MTAGAEDTLANLEQLRQSLESELEKLRTSLRYWQTWEAEYEGFKEELESVEHEPSSEEIIYLGSHFGGNVINEREVKGLVGFKQNSQRTRKQILAAIRGRVDTGQKNAAVIQKQIEKAEEKLEKVLAVANPAAEDDEGEEVMEIYEELDDEGNVISSRVTNADKGTDKIDAALKKAKALQNFTTIEKAAKLTEQPQQKTMPSANNRPQTAAAGLSMDKAPSKGAEELLPEKKSVSFAKKLEQIPPEAENSERWKLLEAERNVKSTPPEIPRVLELDEDDQVIGSRPLDHLPISAEERARHQREVFENASTIGPIVASMDIEEGLDFEEDDDMYELRSESADDDDFDMTALRNGLTPDYIAEMEALMEKHATAMANVGPQDAGFPLAEPMDSMPEPKPAPVMPPSPVGQPRAGIKKPTEKGVRFAEELDIAGPPERTMRTERLHALPARPKPPIKGAPIADIVERAPVNKPALAPDNGGKKKMSRFKTAKLGGEA